MNISYLYNIWYPTIAAPVAAVGVGILFNGIESIPLSMGILETGEGTGRTDMDGGIGTTSATEVICPSSKATAESGRFSRCYTSKKNNSK